MTTVRPLITPFAVSLLTLCSWAYADISISEGDGTLSIQASDVTASELAAELTDQLGINVVVTGEADTQVNVDIVDEPLEIALGKLSPNNMVVRNSQGTEITEVVLMMGEGSNSSAGGASDQFLPSGSPAEAVQTEQATEQAAGQATGQASGQAAGAADQAGAVRDAAASASNDPNLPAGQVPPMFAEDGQEIDPATGLPRQQQ